MGFVCARACVLYDYNANHYNHVDPILFLTIMPAPSLTQKWRKTCAFPFRGFEQYHSVAVMMNCVRMHYAE